MSFPRLLALVALVALTLSPLSAEAASALKIVNGTASEIHAIYISDSGTDSWEENIISGYMLPPGNEVDIQINGSYGQFDLRVEDGDGNYEEYTNFPGNTSQIILNGGGDSEYQ